MRGPNDRVASVGGRPIPMAHLEERVDALSRGPRGRHLPPDGERGSLVAQRWAVRELVDEAILALEAEAAGLPPTAIDRLVERVTAGAVVDEADVTAYYERNGDRYRRPESRLVRLATRADAAAAERLAEHWRRPRGADDVDEDGDGGGPIDLHRGEMAGDVEDAVFAAPVGSVVGPIRTELGWHVARVEASLPQTTVPFEEARPEIEATLLQAARGRTFDEWLDRRRRALAVVEAEFEHPGHPVHGMPVHRH
jgi:[acyl-carrier-protein] S-malonyltransferase